jgi:hypothetical protein
MHAYPVFTQFEGRLDDTDIEKAWKTQKWKRLKISPLSFWEKHKKPKALSATGYRSAREVGGGHDCP